MTAVPIPPISSDIDRLISEAGVEFANGQIVEKPVSIESTRVEGRIFRLLSNEAERTKAAEVFSSSLGYQCYRDDPRKFRRPDVSVVRTDRLAAIDASTGMMPIPADLVVEVLSPTDAVYDVWAKVEEYLRNGFPLVWLVYPNTRNVTVHRADGTGTILRESDEIMAENALPGFRCRVTHFFSAPA